MDSPNQPSLNVPCMGILDNLGVAGGNFRASVGRFVVLFVPGTKGDQGFFAHQLDHGNFAVGVGELDLAVNEGVVKTEFCGVGGGVGEKNANGPGPVDGAEAHRARLTARIHFAAGEFEGAELFACGADSHYFGVSGGIILDGNGVNTLGNNFSFADD